MSTGFNKAVGSYVNKTARNFSGNKEAGKGCPFSGTENRSTTIFSFKQGFQLAWKDSFE